MGFATLWRLPVVRFVIRRISAMCPSSAFLCRSLADGPMGGVLLSFTGDIVTEIRPGMSTSITEVQHVNWH